MTADARKKANNKYRRDFVVYREAQMTKNEGLVFSLLLFCGYVLMIGVRDLRLQLLLAGIMTVVSFVVTRKL